MSNMRKVSTNVSDALNYCRTSSSPSVSCDFLHDIRSSISPSHNLGVVETLLSCGYTTSHPLSLVTSSLFLALIALFLQALLSQTRQKLFNNLLQGRLRCSGTCFLMGLPDPTHTLASDEVFVPGWSSCDCRHLYQDCYNGYCQDDSSVSLPIDTPTSDVLVSRFPLHSPEGIRKLHLINDCFCCSKKKAPLIEFFNPLGHFIPDVGGVIVFGSNPALSSQYNCPVVSDMNGDYDGDLYWVCTEPRLVNSFCDSKECRTRVSDEEMPPTESTFVSPIVDDLPLIHSPVENFLGVSQRLSVDSCRYLSLISLSFDEIQSKPSEIVMEALLWEGLTPFSNRHQCSLKNFCQHDSLTKYLKIVATTVGVARCEHLWNVKADIYGVESKEAQYYHRLHDKLLVSRKHGYYLHELLNNPHHPPVSHTDIQLISAEYLPPHYLLPRGLKNFKFMAGQHYYSTSILGKLSDLVRELESSDGDDPHDSEIQEQSSTTTIELDPQLQADFDICCCYNETYDGSSHDKRNHVIHQSWSDMARLVDPKSVKSTYLLAAQEIFMRYEVPQLPYW